MFKGLLLTVLCILFLSAAAFANVNINTAGVKELISLPGIGLVKAAAIVDYRTMHGSFKAPDELKRVKGIGKKTMDKLRDQITVDEETDPHP